MTDQRSDIFDRLTKAAGPGEMPMYGFHGLFAEAAAEIARLREGNDGLLHTLRSIAEELVMMGYPAGDRTVVLANFRSLRAEIERKDAALKPFADYADPRSKIPPTFAITDGSALAKRQLTMGDCYAAREAHTAGKQTGE